MEKGQKLFRGIPAIGRDYKASDYATGRKGK
jgi:hypothetical protein